MPTTSNLHHDTTSTISPTATNRVPIQIMGHQSRTCGTSRQQLTLVWATDGFYLTTLVTRLGLHPSVMLHGIVPLNLIEAFVIYAEMHQPSGLPAAGDWASDLLDPDSMAAAWKAVA